ncbi:MAG: hypothetical protein WB332_06775 [Bryobacteraceae bacterium]
MMKARCHSTIARKTIPFAGDGWRHGVARARNWRSFAPIELESVDTEEAVRQIFGGDGPALPPPSSTSALVKQQAWFARIQRTRRE